MSELGEALAAERRRAGRTVAEVEAATMIRGRLIEALERGEWDRLPSPAYVKGYIQSYARYLEVPAEPLLEIYRRESGEQVGAPRRAPRVVPRVPKREELHLLPMRTALIIAAVIAVAAMAVWGLARLVSPRHDTGPSPLPVSPSKTTSATSSQPTGGAGAVTTGTPGVIVSPDGATPQTDAVPIGAEFELKVTVRRGEACWVVVKVDGLRAYEGMMTDGESKTWLVRSDASVAMGRPTAVLVYRGGQQVTEKWQLVGKVPTYVLTAEQ